MHLDDQRLNTSWQQKAMTKLLGLQYRPRYKKRVENRATDALSRVDLKKDETLLAIVRSRRPTRGERIGGFKKLLAKTDF